MKHYFGILILLLQITVSTAGAGEKATVDLKCFREQALRKIHQLYGNVQIKNELITFHDGVGSIQLPPLFDYARLVFTADVPGVLKDTGAKVGYYVSLQGFEASKLVTDPAVNAIYFESHSLITLFREGVSAEKIAAIRKKVSTEFPEFSQEYLEQIGILLIQHGPPKRVPSLKKMLSQSGLFSEVTLDGETYRVVFGFDYPIKLADGLTSKKVDLDSLRTISKKYKDEGLPFTTESKLPQITCD
ncbi:MAG: hypothetical protein ABL958_02380 [Bdellovibrionia bacterium]